ncbi:MAG: PAS domain-containing protein [Dehalococcoidia bacterium]|nr:PAS domain-containing protein [Dehalococcoidia bacterium]
MEPRDILEMLIASPDGTYAVDTEQRVFLWNASAERALGWKAEEVLGKPCYQVLAGPAAVRKEALPCTRDCAPIQQARRGSVAPAQRLLAFTREGTPRWISVTHVLVPSMRCGTR